MLLTLMVLLFQITQTLCNNKGEEQAELLASTFHYDFTRPPNVGNVVVWIISPGRSEIISRPEVYTNYMPEFETNKTYLIFTQTVPQTFVMYFWIGRMAPLGDKILAARYALQQYILYQEYTERFGEEFNSVVTREEEYIESESFWNTINFIDRMNATEKLRYLYAYVDKQLQSRFPVLYILKGTNTATRFKGVPLSTQWLKNDICLLMDTGYLVDGCSPVITFCGPSATTLMQQRINEYRHSWEHFYSYIDSNDKKFISRDDLKFKAFLEVLEDINNFNPYEMDDSQDHLKSGGVFVADFNNDITIYRISKNGMQRTSRDETGILEDTGCYLYDTASAIGLMLFLHYEEELEVKLKAVEMVEDYIHNNYSLASKSVHMRISEISQSVRLNYCIDIAQ